MNYCVNQDNDSSDKSKIIKAITEEILDDFEGNRLSFETLLFKIKKLARLRDDFETLTWINLEIMGYKDPSIIPDFPPEANLVTFARKSGRMVHNKDDNGRESEQFWVPSISEIEMFISNAKASMETVQIPSNYTPAIAKFSNGGSLVQENFRNVLDKLATQKKNYSDTISLYSSLLSKIRNMFYSYVLNVYYQVAFDNITETIFQKTQKSINEKLQKINPSITKKLVAAYNRVNSDNEEELSQAMSSCRNALKEFADTVFPAREGVFKRKDGSEMIVSDDKYKNRLIAFIEEHESKTNKEYLIARSNDLITRIHSLNDILSKGTHVGLDANFINICIIDTFLVIGGMLDYFEDEQTSFNV